MAETENYDIGDKVSFYDPDQQQTIEKVVSGVRKDADGNVLEYIFSEVEDEVVEVEDDEYVEDKKAEGGEKRVKVKKQMTLHKVQSVEVNAELATNKPAEAQGLYSKRQQRLKQEQIKEARERKATAAKQLKGDTTHAETRASAKTR